MKLNLNLKEKSFGEKMAFLTGILSLVACIIFCIYGIVYNRYFDIVIMLCFLAAGVCSIAYTLFDNRIADYGVWASVILNTYAIGLGVLNSYEVWADWYGGFTMYGSEGGIGWVLAYLIPALLACITGIIACFSKRKKKAAAEEVAA